jgi:hypothetical protein
MCAGVAGLRLAAITAFCEPSQPFKYEYKEFRHQPKKCQGFQKCLALRS